MEDTKKGNDVIEELGTINLQKRVPKDLIHAIKVLAANKKQPYLNYCIHLLQVGLSEEKN